LTKANKNAFLTSPLGGAVSNSENNEKSIMSLFMRAEGYDVSGQAGFQSYPFDINLNV